MISSLPNPVKQAAATFALITGSLGAGLAVRFVWLRWRGVIAYNESHWRYVDDSLFTLLQWAIPSLLLGGVLFWLFTLATSAKSPPQKFPLGLLALTLFFAGLLGTAWLFDLRPILGLNSILIGWLIAILARSALHSAGRLETPVRKVVFSRPTQLLIDGAVVGVSFWLAYLFRFDGEIPDRYSDQLLFLLPYSVLVQIAANYLWGVYSFMWRFTSLRESIVIGQSVGSVALLSVVLRIAVLEPYPVLVVPFGVVVIHPVLNFFGFMATRTLRRLQYHAGQRREGKDVEAPLRKRVLLVGAGQAGQLLVRELDSNPAIEMVGFLDDDPRKISRVIQGVKVLGSTDDLVEILRRQEIDEVVLCMPTAPKSVFRKVISRSEEMGVRTSSVPSLSDVVDGKVSISQLRPVRMEDLLGRDSVAFATDDPRLQSCYSGKRILVTGAAGSIGSELVRQLKELKPDKLIVLDQDENGLFEVGLEIGESLSGTLVQVIADIRDRQRLARVFQREQPQVVFHAAAYKHVPMMELHPGEAILNNAVGTRNVAETAARVGCESFVLISTDKAVNPSSMMGASKRLAEMVVQHLSSRHLQTRFCCVRFGNVLGSRGSVVPLFQKQIAQGKDITVTDPSAKRYFMSIPEAVQLVIQAGSLGDRGEIFVLDMGEPVRILDLARELIERSGLTPDQDVRIRFTGLRPGEKLSEELLIGQETGIRHTQYPKIFVAQALSDDWPKLSRALENLETAAINDDADSLFATLDALEIGYRKNEKEAEELATTSVED